MAVATKRIMVTEEFKLGFFFKIARGVDFLTPIPAYKGEFTRAVFASDLRDHILSIKDGEIDFETFFNKVVDFANPLSKKFVKHYGFKDAKEVFRNINGVNTLVEFVMSAKMFKSFMIYNMEAYKKYVPEVRKYLKEDDEKKLIAYAERLKGVAMPFISYDCNLTNGKLIKIKAMSEHDAASIIEYKYPDVKLYKFKKSSGNKWIQYDKSQDTSKYLVTVAPEDKIDDDVTITIVVPTALTEAGKVKFIRNELKTTYSENYVLKSAIRLK